MKELLFVIPIVLLTSLPSAAQDVPAVEIFGGYSLISNEGINLNGFSAAVEGNLNRHFGIVGEFNYGRKAGWKSVQEAFDYSINATFNGFLFMGGPRFSYRMKRARAFGHFLAGAYRLNTSYNQLNRGVSSSGVTSSTRFSMAIGGGIDIVLTDRISVRPVQLDWLNVRYGRNDQYSDSSNRWDGMVRYSAGIVFRVGKK